jgi:hypothetical protein
MKNLGKCKKYISLHCCCGLLVPASGFWLPASRFLHPKEFQDYLGGIPVAWVNGKNAVSRDS